MLDISFLEGQADPSARVAQIASVSARLAAFISAAKYAVHVCIYDFRLTDPAVVDALNERAAAGVVVRVAYFQPRDTRQTDEAFAAIGADPAPGPDFSVMPAMDPRVLRLGVAELDAGVEKEGIDGMGRLLHDKYVVRDGMTPFAALWTGSANFTDDAFSLQENMIVTLESQDLCQFYETDFAELWSTGRIATTGKGDLGGAVVDGVRIDVAFAPGEGRTIDNEIASRIAAATSEIAIACMVISSPGILGALSDAIDRGVAVTGIYDATQMRGVETAWNRSGSVGSAGKLALWNAVKPSLVGKNSTPFTATGPHDYMHNKFVVLDRATTITGSFNFSSNATRNAENVLTIADPGIAARSADEVARLVARYG